MKRSLSLLVSLLLLVLLVFSSCAANRDVEYLKENGYGFYCDEVIYKIVPKSQRRGVLFCGEKCVAYEEKCSFVGLKTHVKHYCSTTDYQVIGLFGDSEDPKDCWGIVPDSSIWVPLEISEDLQAFFEGEYSSYKLLSTEDDCYYELDGEPLEKGSYFHTTQTSNNSTLSAANDYILYNIEGICLLGCDSSGELGRVIGKVIPNKNGYYYFPMNYNTDKNITGYQLTAEARRALEAFMKDSEVKQPEVVMQASLETLFETERHQREQLTAIAVVLILLIVFFLFFRKIVRFFKGMWDWLVRQAKDGRAWAKNRRAYELEPPSTDEEYKPLNFSLTKEEIVRNTPEEVSSEETESAAQQSVNRRFCPVCGAPCDWSSLQCGTCGAELTIYGKKVVKVNPINAPVGSNGVKHGLVLDVGAVSFSDYLSQYAPAHLRRSTNRFSVWYFVLSVLAFFSSLLVYGDLLLLTQSVPLSLMSLLPGVGLLVLAILYRRSRGLGYSVVFAVYTVLSVLSTILSMTAAPSLGALTTGNPLDSVVYIAITVVECILYLLFSFLGLYRTIQLRSAYRDFKDGKSFRMQ